MNNGWMDVLEPRTLRSATLHNGMLSVIGTAHRDAIFVYTEPKDPTKIDVKLNNHVTQFNMADVTNIYVNARRGDDMIAIGQIMVSAKDNSTVGSDVTFPSRVYGGAGSDYIYVLGGSSHIFGGESRDEVHTEMNHSPITVYGEGGPDFIRTGFGDDLIVGGEGDDQLSTNPGNDTIDGGDGDDTIGDYGGIASPFTGNDLLVGGNGNDHITGTLGDDRIWGGDGDDTVLGAEGNDTITGGIGNDSLDGGAGDNSVADPGPV